MPGPLWTAPWARGQDGISGVRKWYVAPALPIGGITGSNSGLSCATTPVRAKSCKNNVFMHVVSSWQPVRHKTQQAASVVRNFDISFSVRNKFESSLSVRHKTCTMPILCLSENQLDTKCGTPWQLDTNAKNRFQLDTKHWTHFQLDTKNETRFQLDTKKGQWACVG